MTEVPIVPEIKFNLSNRLGKGVKAFSLNGEELEFDGEFFHLKNLKNYACIAIEIK